uniref:Uncharacterized protein n=1 Tax=Geobacter sp. (strain M21) TaxID=443144 RepID=C6DZR1_GEOSM
MRKMAMILATTFFTLSSVPTFAQTTTTQKDECLLASKNCMNQVDDIRTRIYKLDKEIKKGNRVYSPQELKKLQDKLNEASEILRSLERPDS